MTRVRSRNPMQKTTRLVRTLLVLLMLFVVVVSVYPFVYMAFLSFMETSSMKLDLARIAKATWTLDNYKTLFKRSNFLLCFKNSTIMTVYAVAVTCAVSSMAAYAFAKKRFRGRQALFLVYLATMMIPTQVTLIPCFLILNRLHMLNTYSAMALPTCGAFGTLLVHQFLKAIPDDLLEAAEIDGCNELYKFTRIVLPLIRPVLVSLAIFTFISVWGSLVLPLIVTNKPEMTTLQVSIATIKTNRSATDYGLMMAASMISFLPPFILYLLLQKQFVEGIALSGTKM